MFFKCISAFLLIFSIDFALAQPSQSIIHFSGSEPEVTDAKDWSEFEAEVATRVEVDRWQGWAYILSGSLVAIGGGVAYENADEGAEKLAYSFSQSLGIAAIGFGFHLNNVGGADRAFFQIITHSKSLKPWQKDELLKSYQKVQEERRRQLRLTRIIAHSLIAGVNVIHAAQEDDDKDLQTALYFLGGVNALAAISLTF